MREAQSATRAMDMSKPVVLAVTINDLNIVDIGFQVVPRAIELLLKF